jgi:hypothetical protein
MALFGTKNPDYVVIVFAYQTVADEAPNLIGKDSNGKPNIDGKQMLRTFWGSDNLGFDVEAMLKEQRLSYVQEYSPQSASDLQTALSDSARSLDSDGHLSLQQFKKKKVYVMPSTGTKQRGAATLVAVGDVNLKDRNGRWESCTVN